MKLEYVKHRGFWQVQEGVNTLNLNHKDTCNSDSHRRISINVPEHLRCGYCSYPAHRGYIPKNIYLKRVCDECDHYRKGC